MLVPLSKNPGRVARRAMFGAGWLAFGCTGLADADERGVDTSVRAPATTFSPAPAEATNDSDDRDDRDDAQGAPNPARTTSESLPSAPPLDEQAAEVLPSPTSPPAPDAGLADAGMTAPLPPSADGACGDGVRFGDACYRLWSLALPWDTARATCLSTDSDLVKIESTEEDDFVATLSQSSVWIGASDQGSDDEFIWTDGSALEFSNWAQGQPDDGEGPDCVEKRQEANEPWYDQRCTTTAHFFVCESQIEP